MEFGVIVTMTGRKAASPPKQAEREAQSAMSAARARERRAKGAGRRRDDKNALEED